MIGPAGDVADLDPALITDGPSGHGAPDVLSDHRSLAAPLPRLQVGSVVEYEMVTTDREPPPGGASVELRPLGNPVPTSSTVIVFSAPVGRPLHRVERRLPAGVHPRHQIIAGRDRWTYELPALPPRDPPEPAVPGDVVVGPYVGAAVAVSWSAVVRDYAALVDRRGQMEQAAKHADAITHRPRVAASKLNLVAWIELGVGSDLRRALDLARRAVQGAKNSHPERNTLAAIEAELGDLGRAELDNRAAMGFLSSSEPDAADWYVAARIDEQLGLVDDAIAIYRRIGKPDSDPFSTAAYAYRRLAALRRAP